MEGDMHGDTSGGAPGNAHGDNNLDGQGCGETAPIIFTAATSTGRAVALADVFTEATPALPWNIYNICSEHEMAGKIEHVQYGMALTLIAIVLLLNSVAIVLRDRLQKKLRG